MAWKRQQQQERRRRGSALSMAIVVSVVVSGLVGALAWVAGAQSQTTGELSKVDQAFYAAESGAQRAAYLARRHELGREEYQATTGSTTTGRLTGTVNGYTYTVTWPLGAANQAVVTSVATNGAQSYTVKQSVTAGGASIVPTIATGGNFDTKNLHIVGDVATNGTYSNAASGDMYGNLYWPSSTTSVDNVYGVIHPNQTFDNITEDELKAKLIPSYPLPTTYTPGATGDQKTYDFRTAINKVIYVEGDVTNPQFPEGVEGTLYVKGKVTFNKPNVKVGAYDATTMKATTKVNIVATQDVEFLDRVDYYVGSVYSLGNVTRKQFNLFLGVIYMSGSFVPTSGGSGTSTIVVGETPSWDPRAYGGVASSTVTISGFSGPLP